MNKIVYHIMLHIPGDKFLITEKQNYVKILVSEYDAKKYLKENDYVFVYFVHPLDDVQNKYVYADGSITDTYEEDKIETSYQSFDVSAFPKCKNRELLNELVYRVQMVTFDKKSSELVSIPEDTTLESEADILHSILKKSPKLGTIYKVEKVLPYSVDPKHKYGVLLQVYDTPDGLGHVKDILRSIKINPVSEDDFDIRKTDTGFKYYTSNGFVLYREKVRYSIEKVEPTLYEVSDIF